MDTAGKQVDQMIDQARFRHHQNRSKFKEAIDYLDQIFEDLKKECDQTVYSVPRPSRPHPANGVSPASRTPVTPLSQKATPTGSIGGGNASNKNAITPVRPEPRPRLTRSTQQQQQDTSKQSPISRIAADPSAGMQKSPRPQPTRTKPTCWQEPMDYDLDERSIGSCSAEVAAINSMDRKKRRQRETPDLLQDAVVPPAKPARWVHIPNDENLEGKSINMQPPPQQQKFDNAPVQPVPIKPQPLRPHPVYGLATSSKAYNFNNHYPQPFREISERVNSEGHLNGGIQHSFKKVASHNQISDRKRSNEAAAPQWRASSQETCNTLSSVRSDDNAVIHRNGAFAQYTPNNSAMRASVNSLPESSTQLLGKTVAKQPDPVLAIDALVAELELNTDETNFTDKRRSFPTRLEASSSNRLPEYEKSKNNQPITNGTSKLSKTSSVDRGVRRVKQQKMAFDEMTNMLRNVAGDIGAEDSSPRFRRSDQLRPTSGTSGATQVLSPFETINQEKLNPSKVEAMQSVFENKHDIAPPAWRRNMWHGRRASKEDENYCEINEFSNAKKEVSSPSGYSHIKPQSPSSKTKFSSVSQPPPVNVTAQQQHHRNQHHPNTTHSSTTNSSVISSSQPSYRAASNSLSRESISSIPAFPVTQPPSQPPGSTNSSQTGGYYSSGSSLGAQSSYATSTNQSSSLQRSSGSGHRGSLNGKQSMCSRPTSVGDDDEDDGFYDNIQIDERRFSSATETDNTSMSSHRLPPSNNAAAKGRSAASGASSTNRFGQFLRKISGSSKPPMNAASLLSLNKVVVIAFWSLITRL
ncbi:unnamed protein product [Anisakis simplex]|uniref:Uncharacterized protein n=1 Tax=Anisakis simplex TaxID=6269 RepID=A0A3P6R486_ANISI|nr:unnamed protein product [Anisakis simplex]